jgi:L-ribulokinase
MFAATAAGLYPKVEDAMSAIGQGFDASYTPDPGRAAIYDTRFSQYTKLGAFIESTTKSYDPQRSAHSDAGSIQITDHV